MKVAVILLAAGASRRMAGRDKLTEDVNGIPLLRHVTEIACASAAEEVIVVLGAHSEARRVALAGAPVRIVENPDWDTGMASSIRAGIGSLKSETDAALVMLGDMPEIDTDLINQLIDAFDYERADIVRPRAKSGPIGNPVLFGKAHFAALQTLSGDRGARSVVTANPDRVADVDAGDDVLVDLDTPEEWAKWRTGRDG